MTRNNKLWEWILANPRASIPFRDFERLLKAFGFSLERTTGSHRQYVHPAVPYVLSVQPRRKEAKSYQVAQFVAMVQEYGLELDE
jgi:predicted RNA binding protein YcfA (HicA-like mRNA interferase family)